MKAAIGFKSHSGWAAMAVIGMVKGEFRVIDRRRIDLIDEGQLWAKQPYHAAEDLETGEAGDMVKRGIEMSRRIAIRRVEEAVNRCRHLGFEVAACAVLIPNPMPEWTTEEILAVHFRMHKAEGVLFPDALCRAIKLCKLRLVAIPEIELNERAEKALSTPMEVIATLGKSVGPPWGTDQKSASLAAMIALSETL